MAPSLPTPSRTAALRLGALLLAISVVLLGRAAPARAAVAQSYDLVAAQQPSCYSGQTDAAGNLYLVCGESLYVYTAAGSLRSVTPGIGWFNDSAPSPDGSYVYVSDYGPVQRLVRQPDGTYAADPSWALPAFPWLGGETLPAEATHITTDSYGDIFIADGMWTVHTPNTVVEYSPAGSFVQRFGQYTDGNTRAVNAQGATTDPKVWTVGEFWGLAGIAASPDGQYVYTSEINNNRVTRWVRQANGTYAPDLTFGNTAQTDPTHGGACVDGMMAAPYDVGVDPWGDVYVDNTSCTQVQKFTADGTWLYSSYTGNQGQGARGVLADGTPQRSHYMAVDAAGDAWTGETGYEIVRPAGFVPDPVPALSADPDLGPALAITGLDVPATTDSATISVALSAAGAPTSMRFSIDEGVTWAAWQPFATTATLALSGPLGGQRIEAEVATAAGTISAPILRVVTVVAPPPVPSPPPAAAPPAPAATPSATASSKAAKAAAAKRAAAKAKAAKAAKARAAARARAKALAWRRSLARMTPQQRARALARVRAQRLAAAKAAARKAAAARTAAATR